MKLLLSGDEYCCYYNGNYYLSDNSHIIIERYLRCFDSVNVVFRVQIVKSEAELGKFKHKVVDERIHMQYFPFFQGPQQFAKQIFKARKAARQAVQDCDMAILRLPSTTAFAVWLACKGHMPYATEIVFDCFDAYNSDISLPNKIIWSILHKMQVNACSNAIGVACVTAHYLQQHYFPRSASAPTSNYSSIELPEEFLYEARKFPRKEQFTIVHTANQVQYQSRKGHNELIEALAIVRQHGINAKILFVGEDYQNGIARLKELAKSCGVQEFVEFPGFVSRSQLRDILIHSDLAVLPTKAEGLPRVIIEAMALGLPCITTPVSGNPELIDRDFLVEYSDVEGQARKITALLTDKQLYENVSKTNFERSKEYTAGVLNARRTAFYNSLISIASNINKLR